MLHAVVSTLWPVGQIQPFLSYIILALRMLFIFLNCTKKNQKKDIFMPYKSCMKCNASLHK